jgi:hypothetical protein
MKTQFLAIERQLNRIEFLLIEIRENKKDSFIGLGENQTKNLQKIKVTKAKKLMEVSNG